MSNKKGQNKGSELQQYPDKHNEMKSGRSKIAAQ